MTTSALDVVRSQCCRAFVRPLGTTQPLEHMIAELPDAPHRVALVGEWAGGGTIVASAPLAVLDRGADPYDALAAQPLLDGDVPAEFVGGGWMGWIGYDAPPFLAFYDHLLRYRDGQWWFEALWSEQREPILSARLAECLSMGTGSHAVPASWQVGEFAGASMAEHLDAVERGVEWIRAGEIYQVNVCTGLAADFTGDSAAFFASAARKLAPRFGAYVAGGARTVACLSPELFLRRRERFVMTSPIKGTAPRTDSDGPTALVQSVKDIAENVMIVDLMRNDLGRVCETGSVRPAALLDIEPHPGVWHLVSTVTGTLRDGVDDAELLRATFPPGSVTGAPKLRALDVIGQLESVPRGVYTGAIGLASPSWGLEFAVAIRTFEIVDNRITLGVGGGVTADSVPMSEWHECLDKAAPLLAAVGARFGPDVSTEAAVPTHAQYAGGLLETVLVTAGHPVRLADHLARLDRSSRELYGHGIPTSTARRVSEVAREHRGAAGVLRIVASPEGQISVTCTARATERPETELRVVRGRYGLWRHKWADRTALTVAERERGAPLFVADDGAVLETSRGNVFLICPDGSLRTPPLRDDVLPGITRRAILDIARDAGRRTRLEAFTVAEMQQFAAFWTSSLSGVVPINSIDGVPLRRRDDDVAVLQAALQQSGATFVR